MGSKGSNQVTSTGSQTYTPAPQVGAAGTQALTAAQAAAQLPFQMPVAPVAGFSPFQNQAFNQAEGLQNFAQPYFNTGAGLLGQSAVPISAQEVANYYNPMASNVTAQMQNIFGQQQNQQTGQLNQAAGGIGNDRIALGQSALANQQGLAAGQTYAGLYQSALQAAQQQQQMEAGAGYGISQMGPAALAAQQNQINQVLGMGGMQQQLAQAQLNAPYQNTLAQIALQYQQPQYLAGITGGLAPAMGGTTQGQQTTTYPSPSPLAQALGVGTSLLGMGGMMGGKGSSLGSAGTGGLGGMFGGYGAYMPGGSAFGATPTPYGNGFSYPMFARGGRAFDDGGATDTYGKLADKEYLQQYGDIGSAAARGNPLAAEVNKNLESTYAFDDGGGVSQDEQEMQDANAVREAAWIQAKAAMRNRPYMPRPDGQKIIPHYDDGGGTDPDISISGGPMGSSVSGYPFPGASNPKIGSATGIPQMQLQPGAGHSGLLAGGSYFLPGMSLHPQDPRQPGISGGSGGTGGTSGGNPSTGQEISAGLQLAGQILPMLAARRGGVIHMADGGGDDQQPSQDYRIGHGDPVFPVDPKTDNLVTGGLKIMAEPAAEIIRRAIKGPGTPDNRGPGGAVDPMQPMATYQEGGDIDFNTGPGEHTGLTGFGDWVGRVMQPDTFRPSPDAAPPAAPGITTPANATPSSTPTPPPPPPAATQPMSPSQVAALPPSAFGHGETPADNPMAEQLERARRATQIQESGGDYGNVTTTRNRQGQPQSALGAYGIMDFNLPQWSKEALGHEVSRQEFLQNPKIQDQIYNYKMGQYLKNYGVEGAGRAWLGGEGSLNAPNAADPFGTTVGGYGRHFASLVGGAGGTGGDGVRNNVGMREVSSAPSAPMGAVQTAFTPPYPGATAGNWGTRAAASPWMSLVRAGAAMASTTGPIGTVLAHGIGAGASELEGQRKSLQGEEGINLKAQQLYDETQRHLDSYNKITANQKEEHDIQRQRNDLLRNKYENLSDTDLRAIEKRVRDDYGLRGITGGAANPQQEQQIQDAIESETLSASQRKRRMLPGAQPGGGPAPPTSSLSPEGTPNDPIPYVPGETKRVAGKFYRTPQGIQPATVSD